MYFLKILIIILICDNIKNLIIFNSIKILFPFQRRLKYNDAKLKALKARNDYLLCMDASNAAIHKYFVDDLSDIIDVSSHFSFLHNIQL